ncbi:MAG: thiamine-binding protein [Lentimicrobiaceae bacterium]|nr:thiamine-binding protein [Lentimicrobiaceae bacterium]MCO5265860.1 thiamine-binding protein [Lentimicrobium sp.]HPG34324.1 thiamine-binding protein [Lentimicrobium sp.]
MKISVELSYYPLNEQFKPAIKGFIAALNTNTNLVVRTNTMATQVFGEFDEVMATIQRCMKDAFELPHSVFVMKVINADLRD